MFIKPFLRGIDPLGSGAYRASRGGRKHNGIDLCVAPLQGVYSHVDGEVTKLGWPYGTGNKSKKDILKSKLRYVQVTDKTGLNHRFFYVKPMVTLGDPIDVGDLLGSCEDLKAIWFLMKNHVHYEVKNKAGSYLDPNKFL